MVSPRWCCEATRQGVDRKAKRPKGALREDVLRPASAAAAALMLLQALLTVAIVHSALLGVREHLVSCSQSNRLVPSQAWELAVGTASKEAGIRRNAWRAAYHD